MPKGDDKAIQHQIDHIFQRYDHQETGCLDLANLHHYINEVFIMCSIQRTVNQT
jgi:hypothetical protein